MTRRTTYSNTVANQWIRSLLPAQILASATPCISSIINAAVIGANFPAQAMAALGLVTPVTTLLSAIATVVSGGARVICGNYLGRGERNKIDDLFSASVFLLVIIGAAFTLAAQLAAAPIATLLGANQELLDVTVLYLRGISIGIIPTLLIPCLMVFLQMGNDSNYAFFSTIVLSAANLLFVLLIVLCGSKDMFFMGAATAGSQFVSAIFLAVRFVFKKDLMRLRFGPWGKGLLWSIIRLGAPSALLLLYTIRNVIMNKVVLTYGGEDALVALSTLNSYSGVFDSLNFGLSSVAIILCSVFIGERDAEGLCLVLRKTVRLSIILGIIKFFAMSLLGFVIGRINGSSQSVIRHEIYMFIGYSIGSGILNITMQSLCAPYQARGKVLEISVLNLFTALIFPCIVMLFVPLAGMPAIYAIHIICEILTLLLITGYSTVRRKHLPKTPEDWMCLEPEFTAGQKMVISIRNMEEATNISERLSAFCTENGIEHRRSMLCGLCLEEMAINAAEHGFSGSGKKNYAIDINVRIEDDAVYMRLRDNTPTADPRTKLGVHEPDDPCKGVGIRLVTKIAKQMSYQACFGLNVMSIEL